MSCEGMSLELCAFCVNWEPVFGFGIQVLPQFVLSLGFVWIVVDEIGLSFALVCEARQGFPF